MIREDLATVRARIAALVKAHPDDSHGDGWRNNGIESALRLIDFAMDAPCVYSPTAYGQWCDLHSSPASGSRDRCNGHQYVADQVIP